MKKNFTFILLGLLKLIIFSTRQLSCKNYLPIFYGLLIFTGGLNAQTTLSAGDIAFIGYNTSSPEGFTFIALNDLPAGQTLYFTEQGWDGTGWMSTLNEPHLSYVIPSGITCGTVITVVETAPDVLTVTGGGSVTFAQGNSFNLSGGDQILAYQSATTVAPASPIFISGVHGDYNSGKYDATTTWNPSSNSTGWVTSDSALPTGLTNGINCISLFPAPGPEYANAKYNGTLTGTSIALRAAINNQANWIFDTTNTTSYAIQPGNYPARSVTCVNCTNPTVPTLAVASGTNTICNGASKAINITGTLNSATTWRIYSGSCGGTLVTSTTTGSFTVTPSATTTYYVRGEGGCVTPGSCATITITVNTAISTATGSLTTVSCNGGSNGSATVSPTGGTSPYTYSWSPSGGTGATASGLSVGIYTVTVTDANGCTATQNFTITQPSALVATPSTQTNVSCFGGSNGTATVTTAGGTPGYTYSWSPSGGTGATASGLTVGAYTCTVTDANGCTATQNFTITQPSAISVTPATQTNVSCFGGSNGAAAINTATGGAGGYTYNWTPGTPTGDGTTSVTGLTAGTWTCTVTDANGCTKAQNFTVTQPAAISVTPATQTNVSCFGGSNGAAAINTATGGAGGYTYNWTPGNPTGDGTTSVTGLTAGTWTCTVTDANGCTKAQNFTVTQPSAISVTPAIQTNVSCFGGSNGAAAINTPSGGAGGYTYNWTPGNPTGDGTASVSGLVATTYTCTVTDANGCTATQNFTITQPSAISVTPATQTNVSCFGGSNGAAAINTATGGAGGYTYNWTPGNPTGDGTTSVTGLTAGTWTCTVTDANGCTKAQNFTVTQPAAISLTPASQTNVACNGGATGAASVNTPTGGAGGYTYNWTPGNPTGDGTASVSGLTAGTWTCTVTDANSCTNSVNFTVTQPTALVATPSSQTNVSCNGGSNGSATVSVTGGTSSYTYSWSPAGGTAATASGLSAGTYTVTVTDANGCQTTQSFTITEPAALIATPSSQTNVSCNSGSNGSATVSVTGGTSSYTYSWSPAGGTAPTATGLSAGTYTVTVTDANGCQTTQSFTITEPAALIATPSSQTNVSCNSGSNGSATVSVTGGTSSYTYSWSPAGGTAATATGLSAGTYTVTVTDANGCQTTQSFMIAQPSTLSFTTTTLSGYDYNTLYSQTIAATGGTGVKSYAVTAGSLPLGFTLSSSGVITGTSTQVADSNFTVTVTDVNSCTATYDFTLKLNQIPITVTAAVSQTKVYGQSDPVLTYTVTPDLLSGDSFTGALIRVTGENIGNYAINAGTLSAGNKYLMTFVSKDFSITAKSITVTAAAKSKTYGDADPALTYTFAPSLVTGDSFSGSLTRSPGENVGTYAINQGSLSAGSNYTITYIADTFTIIKANQLITWDQTLGLGCDGETTVVLNATSNSGLPVSYTSSNTAISIISDGTLVFQNYGSATITASQAGDNNYNAASVVDLPVINSQPNLIRKQFEDIIFFDNSSNSFTSYSWYKNGVLVSGQTDQYFKENGALNGTYYAVATKLDGTLIHTCPLTLAPTVEEEYIKIVPNPAKPNTSYELVTNVSSLSLQNASVEVYTVSGLLIENKTISENKIVLKAPMIEGIYIVKMTLANGKYFTKNVLVKN